MVSFDVKSLHKSIPNAEGIKAVKDSFDKHTSKNVATRATTFLALILPLNNIVFNCKHYLQKKGCAMGTICTPSYSNIFINHFEKKYIYPSLQEISLICLQFMDGIFLRYRLVLKSKLQTISIT